jgi:hypothetical protein
MTFTATWYCTEELEPAWSVPGWDGWRVHVEGDAPLGVDIRFAIPEGRMGEMTLATPPTGPSTPSVRLRRAGGHPHHRGPAADHPGPERLIHVPPCAGAGGLRYNLPRPRQ